MKREERSWLFASSSSVVVEVVEVDGEDEVVRRQCRGAWRRRREVGTGRDGDGGDGRRAELRRRERSLQERMSMAAIGMLGGGGASPSALILEWRERGHTARTHNQGSVWVRKEVGLKKKRFL